MQGTDTFALKAVALILLVIALVGAGLYALFSYARSDVVNNSATQAYAAVSRQGQARVYFRINSDGRTRPFQFTQASSPDARSAAIYLTHPDGRVAPAITPVKSPGGLSQPVPVVLPEGGSGAFQPDGYFVLLRGLKKSVYAGDQLTVELTGPDDTQVRVVARAVGEHRAGRD